MILATPAGNREVRVFGAESAKVPTYAEWAGLVSSSGVVVTTSNALGLPTVGAAIRLISETVGSLPLEVYEGEDADKRRARESDQWRLLHEQPNPDQSAFDLMADIAASIESHGNAFVRKLKARGEVLALYLIPPWKVTVKRDEGNRKVFDVWAGEGSERLTDAQVLHVRGHTPAGGDVGLSPIAQHRESLGSALALQRFQGRFFQNDGTPPAYLQVPERLEREQADALRREWQAKHGGLENAGQIAILHAGAELKSVGIPLRDAQFIESQAHSADLAARIFLGPAASLLGGSERIVKTEEESLRFVNFCLLPRLRRIERAFKSDPDLFPEDSRLYPGFFIDEFLRADAATRAEVRHKELQTGVLLVDEARAEIGRPPLPDGIGQVPQVVPVGGSPFGVPAPNGSEPEE